MECNIWKTSKQLDFVHIIQRIWISCQFLPRTEEQCMDPESWAAVGALQAETPDPRPSSSLLGYTGCHCTAKVWQTLISWASLQPSAPVLKKLSWHVIFHLGKIYFARFLLQFACALLAPLSISRVTGTCSKGRMCIVWFAVQIWFCSCWAKTLMLDSSGSNAWTHSILIFFKDLKNALKWHINRVLTILWQRNY